jgi:fatty-acyl-CoA synthase
MHDRTRALARGFAALGVRRGDRVAVWLPNRAAWLVTFFACAQLGAIAIAVNTRFRQVEVGDLLRRSEAKLLVYWPGFKDVDFENILARCSSKDLAHLRTIVAYTEDDTPAPAGIAGKPVERWVDLLACAPLGTADGMPDSLCAVFTTSGTTKAPKLVAHSQRTVLSHAANVARQYELGPDDRFLLLPPFCGVYGFSSAMAALSAETPIVLAPTWHPGLFADLIDRHAVTHLTASNESVAQLLAMRNEARPFPSVKFIVAANLNPAYSDIATKAAERGICVIGLYGSSELHALFSHCERNGSPAIRGRAGGRPCSAVAKIRTRDPETGTVLTTGEAGELEVYAPESRFIEYLGDPQSTRAAFSEDGYFRTGDLAVIEPDGSFTYLGRMGDTLRLGGFLVAPAEIEEMLQEHPSVEACQLVAVQYQDALRPIAFARPRSGSKIDEQALIAFAAERIAKYKVPVRIFPIDEFPTTPSANGTKIQKTRLRELAEEHLNAGTRRPPP